MVLINDAVQQHYESTMSKCISSTQMNSGHWNEYAGWLQSAYHLSWVLLKITVLSEVEQNLHYSAVKSKPLMAPLRWIITELVCRQASYWLLSVWCLDLLQSISQLKKWNSLWRSTFQPNQNRKYVDTLSAHLFQETWHEQGYGVLAEILSAKETSWHEVVHRQPHV